MVNGIIFQKKHGGKYQGVEGDNWYLDDYAGGSHFEEFFSANIDKSWLDDTFVDVCSDMAYIKEYYSASKQQNIDFRMIVCETDRLNPVFEGSFPRVFIGFDYAYTGGSYYSAVNNDVASGRIGAFAGFELNEYGLFNNQIDLKRFIDMRERLISAGDDRFEGGDFVIYKLFEIRDDCI